MKISFIDIRGQQVELATNRGTLTIQVGLDECDVVVLKLRTKDDAERVARLIQESSALDSPKRRVPTYPSWYGPAFDHFADD